jgi:ABC-type uncharacterized transport system permease subunit
MIVAVAVNRTMFGLGLITSSSLGLAAVLMGLGVLLVRCRAWSAASNGSGIAGRRSCRC